MRILGISTSHDSGAALIEDGRIISAINEERLQRIKLFWGIPKLAIKEVLRTSNTRPEDVDYVAICGILPSGGPSEFMCGTFTDTKRKRLFKTLSSTGITSTDIFKKTFRSVFRNFRKEKELVIYLKELGIDVPMRFIEHHIAHAASAYYTCPYKDPIIVTTDSAGDALCSVVCTAENGEMVRRAESSFFHSPGEIYAYVTMNMGYRPARHEGKITGLAAYGKHKKTYPLFQKMISPDTKRLRYNSHIKCWGMSGARKVHAMTRGHKREDIAAGVQKMIEEVCSNIVCAAAEKYGKRAAALAGGVFANVKLNQRIAENKNMDSVYIHPNMGDGGLAVGSALKMWADLMVEQGKVPKPFPIDNVYFGPSFTEKEMEDALKRHKIKYSYHKDVEAEIANLIAKKKIVGRFNGRMEYGPRALGNRSILADPTDVTINDWLNKRLKRTEFMPFAPSIMREHADEYYKNFKNGEVAAQFMTITFDVTDRGVKTAPAVSHVDRTARPQTVTKEQNPSYYSILKEYKKLTGMPIFVNTSFNMHEEPIVCTPDDAIRAFQGGSVDILAMGNFIAQPRT